MDEARRLESGVKELETQYDELSKRNKDSLAQVADKEKLIKQLQEEKRALMDSNKSLKEKNLENENFLSSLRKDNESLKSELEKLRSYEDDSVESKLNVEEFNKLKLSLEELNSQLNAQNIEKISLESRRMILIG